MKGLRAFIGLQPGERGLVLRTLLLVAAIRVALWVMPFQRLQRFVGSWISWKHLTLSIPNDMPVGRLVWAVRAASRRIPAASCLTQSLALHCLLTRAGHRSEVLIGVTKDMESGFGAHAWVEYAGQPLLSGPEEVEQYVQLLTMEGKPA
jgi:Transglutaminase-like superfamily